MDISDAHPRPAPTADPEDRGRHPTAPLFLELPAAMRDLLGQGHRLEQLSVGGDIRRAQRNMRFVISGLLAGGVPVQLIATELGVTTGNIRARAQPGELSLDELAQLAGCTRAELLERCADAAIDTGSGFVSSDDLTLLLPRDADSSL